MVVYEGILCRLSFGSFCGKFLGGIEGIIGITLFHQFLGVFPVDAASL